MHVKISPYVAAFAMVAGLALSGCGEAKPPAPGVGQPNPNGKGMLVAESGKTPAQSPDNAARDDIKSFKEFKEKFAKAGGIHDLQKNLGPAKIAYTGPYAGNFVYPNLYFDGWFVESVMIESVGSDFRKFSGENVGYRVKEIPFIRPENIDWFVKPKESN